ncbi:hypothetical protein F383_14881 [Gossypium arboreum]|uniref:Uncharacterized protein n=1 Tax=Gossypium arboreum TaxID=29729 RepID=A0A0B0NEW3_GOSAR|nr:hypothetical protein F383_14881 [Gossypium arboreum]
MPSGFNPGLVTCTKAFGT